MVRVAFLPTEEVQGGQDPESSPVAASNFLCDMSIKQLISYLLGALIHRAHLWLKHHKFPKIEKKKSHRTNNSSNHSLSFKTKGPRTCLGAFQHHTLSGFHWWGHTMSLVVSINLWSDGEPLEQAEVHRLAFFCTLSTQPGPVGD